MLNSILIKPFRVIQTCKTNQALSVAGKSPPDMRGKHPSPKDSVCEHMLSFPAKYSHYSVLSLKYLDAQLNVKIMYYLFKQKHPYIMVGYQFYYKYFSENFRLSFDSPALTDTECFKKIVHFPFQGHSFLPCDMDLSMIKRMLKKNDRIYNIHHITELIVSSSKSQKFTVNEIHDSSAITDYKMWLLDYYKKTCISEEIRSSSSFYKQHYTTHFHSLPFTLPTQFNTAINSCLASGQGSHK
ncbi:hypothetical protein PR048_021325 [Dryococelus australis]|uniref:Uncharacterized protein n=1 Tax=Dryococelus australis TaxID=614101 RepID=A0ABQ9GXZ2_9NEOP|nr:hypothetical protein PR048_021325 [Dryococelus australis]